MLTRIVNRLDRIGSSRATQTIVGACVLLAGLTLGSGWQAATTVATEQAASVTQVCDSGGAAARELTVAGTCEQAAAVVAGPRGLTGSIGATGATGPAGADSTVPGPVGATGGAGINGVNGESPPCLSEPTQCRGADGADSTVPGPTGATGAVGAVGATGARGETGATGAPGPTCPEGTELQPVVFASGQNGLGCVTPEQGAPDGG